MNPRKKKPSATNPIRQEREGRLQVMQMHIKEMSPEEIRTLVYDLQVHQIELEVQNEELRETQLELEVARDRYATLFDFSPVGYVTLDQSDRIQEVNLRFCKMVGADRKDLLLQSFIRFLDPGDQPIFRQYLNALAPSSSPGTSEVLTLRGANLPHRIRLESCVDYLSASNLDPLYRIAVVDVTEKESALRLNAGILQSTKEGIYGLDCRGSVTFFNRSGEDLTGWKFSDLCGRSPHDYLHHTKPDGSPYPGGECPVLETLESKKSVSNATELMWRKDGSSFPAEYASTPILNELGQVEGAVVTFRDITERKQAEEQLRTSRDLLARHQVELQALTAKLFTVQEEERKRISHELHDDISQRLALLQIKLQLALPSQSDSKYQEIFDDVKRLSDDVRKIVYRYHPYTLQDLGLESSLRSLVADFMKWEHLPITLSIQPLPAHLPPEVTTCIYRVAQESFQNVAKHARATSVHCELTRDDGGLRLIIEDNGVGFTKAEPAASNGLGLVSMQERAHSIQGHLLIDSAPGKGTTIVLQIPWRE
jgi:PAS domain S-box-containing protein